jgi:hypothetical protein
MNTRVALSTLAISVLALGACEQPVQEPRQGDRVVRDWIAAAVDKDGQTYCGLMTPRLLQQTTGQSGEAAKKTCERQIKAGAGDYPFQFEIPKPTSAKADAAQVAVSGQKLRGRVTLKQQKGTLLVDVVQ